jgi:hypothetical protein
VVALVREVLWATAVHPASCAGGVTAVCGESRSRSERGQGEVVALVRRCCGQRPFILQVVVGGNGRGRRNSWPIRVRPKQVGCVSERGGVGNGRSSCKLWWSATAVLGKTRSRSERGGSEVVVLVREVARLTAVYLASCGGGNGCARRKP